MTDEQYPRPRCPVCGNSLSLEGNENWYCVECNKFPLLHTVKPIGTHEGASQFWLRWFLVIFLFMLFIMLFAFPWWLL